MKKIVWTRNDEHVIKMCFLCKSSLDFPAVGVKRYPCRITAVDYDSTARNLAGWRRITIKKWNLPLPSPMVELNTSTTPLNHYSGHRDAAKGRQRLKLLLLFIQMGLNLSLTLNHLVPNRRWPDNVIPSPTSLQDFPPSALYWITSPGMAELTSIFWCATLTENIQSQRL